MQSTEQEEWQTTKIVCKKTSIFFEMDVMESILKKIMTNYASEFSNSGSENPRQSIFPVRRS